MNERRCQVIVLLSKYSGDESAKTDRDMGMRRRGKERGREGEKEREREGEREGGGHNIVLFVFLRDYLTGVRVEFLYSERGRASLVPP